MTAQEKVIEARRLQALSNCECGCDTKHMMSWCSDCTEIMNEVDKMELTPTTTPRFVEMDMSLEVPSDAKDGDVVAVLLTASDWDKLRGLVAANPAIEDQMKELGIMKMEVHLEA